MNKTPETKAAETAKAESLAKSLPRHEAMAIACWVTGRDRSWFAARRPDEVAATLLPGERALIDLLSRRRLAGEPLAYLLGFREFFGRRFMVSPSVLIPRSDTECLLEAALDCLADQHQHPATAPKRDASNRADTGLQVLDLGTGSGCLAISLTLEAKAKGWVVEVTATDQSASALQVARNNAHWLGAPVTFCQGDWYEALGEARTRFDLVVSNPPYIAAQDPHLDQGDLPFEPPSALAGCSPNADGLDDLRQIIEGASAHLRRGGWLMVEHGYDQQAAVIQLMREAGFDQVTGRSDWSGTPRLVMGQL
ncbi:MAG: peptide chain release factor N(5)-glutamine methyltransferase [Burkholderiaceae bacterium]